MVVIPVRNGLGGENIDLYDSSNNLIENSIGYGSVPYFSITVRSRDPASGSNNNNLFGDMAVYAGMNKDRTIDWPTERPQPTACSELRDWTAFGQRSGFGRYGEDGTSNNNHWKDILAWGNAGHGFVASGSILPTNSSIIRATIINNGLDNGYMGNSKDGPVGTNVTFNKDLSAITISDSLIEGTDYQGVGARLDYRYVDGNLMDGTNGQAAQSLWPWPMEKRIVNELGISVTDEIYKRIIQKQSPPAITPTPTDECQPGTVPGDANGDCHVNGFDYVPWWQNFGNDVGGGASEGDFDEDGKVDGFDYVIWWQNFGT